MGKSDKTVKVINSHGPLGFVLFMAYIGAAVYFVHQSNGFFGFIWAFVKAGAWPGIIVYHVFQSFGV